MGVAGFGYGGEWAGGVAGVFGGECVVCGAFGVLVDGVLMEVGSAAESEVGGAPYVYRLC